MGGVSLRGVLLVRPWAQQACSRLLRHDEVGAWKMLPSAFADQGTQFRRISSGGAPSCDRWSSWRQLHCAPCHRTAHLARSVKLGVAACSPLLQEQLPFAMGPHLALQRTRQFSSNTRTVEGSDDLMPVVYQGPYSAPLKSVKMLSVSTCAFSVAMGPIITFYSMPGVDVIIKGSMAALCVLASATTTGALHWLSSPYIHQMRWKEGSPAVEVQTLSWLATVKTERLNLADIRVLSTNRPLVTFFVNGKPYYIEKSMVENPKLLAKLNA